MRRYLLILTLSSVASATCGFGTPAGATCVGYITSTSQTTWTPPTDWTNTNQIETIAGGGGGGGYFGGGGGAYSAISNTSTLTSGTTVGVAIGVVC